jgi:hypothetical protein
MAGQIVLGVPAAVLQLNQLGLLERAFHDGLYPNLAFRAEAMPEEWPSNTGQELFMTRPGLLKPSVKPIQPGTDPVGQTVPYEQWAAYLAQFADSIDTHMPTSVTSQANQFLRNIKQLGLQAGQSVNRIARNSLFQAYLSGQTVAIAAVNSTDTTVRVASLNGFTTVTIPGSQVRPQPVSASYPLPITLVAGATTVSASVVGYTPDDPTDPIGPGTLALSAQVGTAFALRSSVLSAYAPTVVRSAPGTSIDAIGAGNSLTLQQIINAVAILRSNNVQPHDDGFYHAHVSPIGQAQFFADGVFQRLNQSLPSHVIYQEGFLGYMSGVMFFMNNEAPQYYNSGNLIATANSGVFADELGAEIVNGGGTQIGRVLITGKGCVYEKYLDESAYVTEAGTMGKIGEFDVVNNGLQIMTERIRLILRAPQDKLQQITTASWSISTSFPIPSDLTAPTGPQLYKRAVVLEYAGA